MPSSPSEKRAHLRPRLVAGTLVVGLLAAACGDDSSDESSGDAAGATSAASEPSAADTVPEDSDAASASSEASAAEDSNPDSESEETAKGEHLVSHARGETSVPDDPEHVVVLEPVALDTAVALGTVPVGSTVLSEETGVPSYLGEDASEVQSVGTVTSPNIEAIAQLRPDLIVGTESRHSELYDRLSDIAPTVFMASQADDWQDNVDVVARALDAESEAEQLLADYEQRCAEIADEHGTEGQTAQLIRPRDDLFTLYGPTSFAGSTLECAGFETPPQEWEDISLDVSPERVFDADLVLVTTTDPDDETSIPEPLGSNTDRFSNLHPVDESFWITGVGPMGGMTVLDDLDEILSGDG